MDNLGKGRQIKEDEDYNGGDPIREQWRGDFWDFGCFSTSEPKEKKTKHHNLNENVISKKTKKHPLFSSLPFARCFVATLDK